MSRPIFGLTASADIGQALAGFYADEGWTVIGTHRSGAGVMPLADRANVHLLHCDVGSRRHRADAAGVRPPDRPWDPSFPRLAWSIRLARGPRSTSTHVLVSHPSVKVTQTKVGARAMSTFEYPVRCRAAARGVH